MTLSATLDHIPPVLRQAATETRSAKAARDFIRAADLVQDGIYEDALDPSPSHGIEAFTDDYRDPEEGR